MLRAMAEKVDVKEGLKQILSKIEAAKLRRPPELQCTNPRLLAVSKTKPVEMILDAYETGQRHFGENYVQELEEKGSNPLILEKCKDIKWHFIGHLQTNKINKVLAVPNLFIIETVHSQKLATNLNKNWPRFANNGSKLNVMVQVNVSEEEEKSGVSSKDAVDLTKYILTECENLKFDGLMTIGELGRPSPNPDFLELIKCRENVCKELGLDWRNVNLSMGMSGDFEEAIERGSTNVRVGTLIFGHREPKVK